MRSSEGGMVLVHGFRELSSLWMRFSSVIVMELLRRWGGSEELYRGGVFSRPRCSGGGVFILLFLMWLLGFGKLGMRCFARTGWV
jgi:hypothetical protein